MIKIIPIIPTLRTLKSSGADIAEAIQYGYTTDELYDHIVGKTKTRSDIIQFFEDRCLGLDDNNQAHFITLSGRLKYCKLESLSKNLLISFLDLSEWRANYPSGKDNVDWDMAINDTMIASRNKDFDSDSTLGRGAWKRKDGEICYHDGIDTYGIKDKTKHYLRKQKKDIGINDKPADVEVCQEIGRIALDMTFESKLDAVRCLAWSCLAPFAGALPWRPAILLTGSSETGKTTIINTLVRRIGIPEFYNGASTTPAGLRADLNNDACGVVFDETEGRESAQKNREELFLVMRQSTSDDAPKVVKSNKDQATVKYNMNNMFLFSSIHAGIEDEADEKRIMRVNLKKTEEHKLKWDELEKRIEKYITEENCRAIRATTWSKLKDIIQCAKIIRSRVAGITNLSSRSAYAEALILSCYFLVWRGMTIDECNSIGGDALVADIYKHHEVEERNEPKETLDKILDTIVFIPEKHENKTLREMLVIMGGVDSDSEKRDYKLTLERYGLKRIEMNLAIQKDNQHIKKILETGSGYNKTLWRHKDCIDKCKAVRMSGSPRSCVVIKGLFDVEELPL